MKKKIGYVKGYWYAAPDIIASKKVQATKIVTSVNINTKFIIDMQLINQLFRQNVSKKRKHCPTLL